VETEEERKKRAMNVVEKLKKPKDKWRLGRLMKDLK
jgi:hypothetical protein